MLENQGSLEFFVAFKYCENLPRMLKLENDVLKTNLC